jgi:hypothetical protein
MIRLWAILALAAGCSETAHIDLKFDLSLDGQCTNTAPGNPPVPMSCEQLTTDCADHLSFRVRKAEGNRPGDIINSRCISMQAAGNPRNLCQLVGLHDPVSLIDSVPDGTRFIFQLAALKLLDPNGGCDSDSPAPLRVFSGFSDPILVDGSDHQATLHLTTCGSCANLSPGAAPDGGVSASDLGAFDLGTFPATDMGAAPYDFATSADAGAPPDGFIGFTPDLGSPPPPDFSSLPDLSSPPDLTCPLQQGTPGCMAPGDRCPDGTPALLPPGGCCAVCDVLP